MKASKATPAYVHVTVQVHGHRCSNRSNRGLRCPRPRCALSCDVRFLRQPTPGFLQATQILNLPFFRGWICATPQHRLEPGAAEHAAVVAPRPQWHALVSSTHHADGILRTSWSFLPCSDSKRTNHIKRWQQTRWTPTLIMQTMLDSASSRRQRPQYMDPPASTMVRHLAFRMRCPRHTQSPPNIWKQPGVVTILRCDTEPALGDVASHSYVMRRSIWSQASTNAKIRIRLRHLCKCRSRLAEHVSSA